MRSVNVTLALSARYFGRRKHACQRRRVARLSALPKVYTKPPLPPPYPTLSEITKRVAGQSFTGALFSRGMQRFVRTMLALQSYV